MELFTKDKIAKIKNDCIKYLSASALFEKLNAQDLPYVAIKGEILSLLAYNQYGQRSYGDLDILVSRKNLCSLKAVLQKLGYSTSTSVNRKDEIMLITSSHQTTPWIKAFDGGFVSVVDVNFDLFWGEYSGRRIDIDKFISDSQAMKVFGVQLYTLSPLKTMVQLILHHFKEMNSIYLLAGHDSINYNMFKDVYYLWKNNKYDISLEGLYSLCSEYKIIPYAYYILYFTNWIFNDEELKKYVEVFRTPEGECYLGYYGLTDKERKAWKVDFQTRLETDNLYELIKDDLTGEDIKKIESNRRIFG